MKIVADRDIVQVADAFSDLGVVQLLPGREITPEHLSDCECLLVRTVTRVDRKLLQHSKVGFVGSATIGTDHVDLDYLRQRDIGFANAAGCNAEAASEYVISGLFALSKKKDFDPFACKAGIIGFGNVGSRLHDKLTALGIDCLINDPPLQDSGYALHPLVDLETILGECDFISLHVPLKRRGKHPSYHFFDADQLQKLRPNCLLVNAARGEVVDNQALLQLLQRRDDVVVFVDTWENEPAILRELMQKIDLATPHIAGYSVEGRLRGTQMILDAACQYFGKRSGWGMQQLLPQIRSIDTPKWQSKVQFWQDLLQTHCDIWRDHDALLAGLNFGDTDFARHFDSLRRVYPDRLEYERFRLGGCTSNKTAAMARRLHFKVS